MDGLINFINTAAEIIDKKINSDEENLIAKLIDQTILFFNEAESFFGFNEKLILSIIRIYKRQNNLSKILFYLEKLINNNHITDRVLCSYIYRNCFIKKWSQEDFFSYGQMLNKYDNDKLVQINNSKDNKIHLGFLTSDIKSNHSITYFLKTVLKNYDKDIFHITLILSSKDQDATTDFFKKYVDNNIDISSLDDIDAINVIRKNNIDIVIDLMGVTSSNRINLFKNRLSNIQISWLGYCNTTGLEEMDYIIADPNLVKKNENRLYSEKIVNLPNIWNCHSGLDSSRNVNPAPFLKNNYLTFGSFNNFNKINEDVVQTWSEILINTPNSRLVLKSSVSMEETIIKNLFKKYGTLESVIFEKKKSFDEHLKLYNSIDIALDTFPYNGVTTSFEAIYMGVPVLTMKGYNFNSRCGESINKNIKMNYLIAENKKEYVFKAKELSQQTDKLLNIRDEIFEAALKSPLFDTINFSKDFFNLIKQLNTKD